MSRIDTSTTKTRACIVPGTSITRKRCDANCPGGCSMFWKDGGGKIKTIKLTLSGLPDSSAQPAAWYETPESLVTGPQGGITIFGGTFYTAPAINDIELCLNPETDDDANFCLFSKTISAGLFGRKNPINLSELDYLVDLDPTKLVDGFTNHGTGTISDAWPCAGQVCLTIFVSVQPNSDSSKIYLTILAGLTTTPCGSCFPPGFGAIGAFIDFLPNMWKSNGRGVPLFYFDGEVDLPDPDDDTPTITVNSQYQIDKVLNPLVDLPVQPFLPDFWCVKCATPSSQGGQDYNSYSTTQTATLQINGCNTKSVPCITPRPKQSPCGECSTCPGFAAVKLTMAGDGVPTLTTTIGMQRVFRCQYTTDFGCGLYHSFSSTDGAHDLVVKATLECILNGDGDPIDRLTFKFSDVAQPEDKNRGTLIFERPHDYDGDCQSNTVDTWSLVSSTGPWTTGTIITLTTSDTPPANECVGAFTCPDCASDPSHDWYTFGFAVSDTLDGDYDVSGTVDFVADAAGCPDRVGSNPCCTRKFFDGLPDDKATTLHFYCESGGYKCIQYISGDDSGVDEDTDPYTIWIAGGDPTITSLTWSVTEDTTGHPGTLTTTP